MPKIDKNFLILFISAFLIFLIASFYYHHKTVLDESNIIYVDFRVYYYAGIRLQAGEDIYNTDDGYYIYKYSPIFALLMSVIRFSNIFPAEALRVWYLILFVSFALCLYLTKEILFYPEARRAISFFDAAPFLFIFRYLILLNFTPSYFPNEWPAFIRICDFLLLYLLLPIYILSLVFRRKENTISNHFTIMGLSVLFILRFLLLNVDRAQVNLVILLLLLFFTYYLIEKKDIMAGIYLGIAAVFKLTPVIFLIYLVLRKKFKALFSFLVTFFALLILPCFKWGMKRNSELLAGWMNTLKLTFPSEYLQHKNQSLFAALSRFFSKNSDIALIKLDQIYLTGLIIFAYILFISILIYLTLDKKRNGERGRPLYDISLFFISMTILSPVGTKATFVYLLLPIALLIREAFERKLKDKLLNIGLLAYLAIIYLNSGDLIGDVSITLDKFSLMTLGLLIIFLLTIYLKAKNVYDIDNMQGIRYTTIK